MAQRFTNQGFQPNQRFPNESFQQNQRFPNQGFQQNQRFSNQSFQPNQSMTNRGTFSPGINNQGQGTHNQGQGMNNQGQGMNNQGQGMYNEGQGMNNQGQGTYNQGQGMYNQGHNQGQGMYNQGHNQGQGMYNQGQGMNNQGHGMNNQGQGMYNQPVSNQGKQPVSSIRPAGGNNWDMSRGHFQSPAPRPPNVNNQSLSQGNYPMSHARPPGNIMQGHGQYPVQQGMQYEGDSQGQKGSVVVQQGSNPADSMQQGPIVQHVMIPVPVPVGADVPPHMLRPQIITSTGPGLPRYQGNFTGLQSHGQFTEMQGQGQMSNFQGQSPLMQGQFQGLGQSSNLTGQGNIRVQSQEQFQHPQPEFQNQRMNVPGFQNPNPNVPIKDSGEDDLNYYMGVESRNLNIGRARENAQRVPNEEFTQKQPYQFKKAVYAEESTSFDENRYQDHESKFQIQERSSHEQTFKRDRNKSFNSQSYIQHQVKPQHIERSGQEFYRKTDGMSSFDRGHVEMYSKYDNRGVKSQEIRNTGQFESQNVFENHDRYGREQQSIQTGRQDGYTNQGNYERIGRPENIERNQMSGRQANFNSVETSKGQNFQRFVRHETFTSDQSHTTHKNIDSSRTFEHVQNSQYANTSNNGGTHRSESERHSEALFYTDGRREDTETLRTFDYRDKQTIESERHSEALLYTNGRREDTETSKTFDYRDRDKQSIESDRPSEAILFKDGKRINFEREALEGQRNEIKVGSDAILYTDRKREDLESRGIEQYEREKRKLSPVSSDRSSRKFRRDFSPISESKSHGELKIHVSDRGRWIETDHNLSPVSDGADDVISFKDSYPVDRNDNDQNRTELDLDSPEGAEMVSDSESYIGEISKADLIIDAQNLSPVSQQSSRHESQKLDDRVDYGSFLEGERKKSPNRSIHSRHSEGKTSYTNRSTYSDDRGRHSHQSRQSEDRQKERRLSPEVSHRDMKKSESKSSDCPLHVPDLCKAHNKKICNRNECGKLHVCRFFILDTCRFGENCTKGHDVLMGQSLDTLNEINSGLKRTKENAEQVKQVLKQRIVTGMEQKLISQRTEPKQRSPVPEKENVVAFDPSFDARNYAQGSNFDKVFNVKNEIHTSKNEKEKFHSKTSGNKKVDSNQGKSSKHTKSISSQREKNNIKEESKSSKSENIRKSNRRNELNEKFSKKYVKGQRTDQDKNMLSPVSGDEDDWEKYDRYEQISDDGLPEKDDDLDTVSSDDSSIEQVQVNRSVDSFPLPTPENIAVPIGMNDPLVFNRPLKNNPQSYIGPLNRPPPMFPIATEGNAQLCQVVPQMPSQASGVILGMPGAPGTVPCQVPNHLPSPEFMKQVIQSLPTFKKEPEEQKNLNENIPAVSETDTQRKKLKMHKLEKDPELKEPIKKLWKFPHKGIVNMSIIEFVTETEAYKEEFIAEIIKILVTLELPYVTMKKLLSVIKEKVSINVKSETDMRKILEMYPNNFRIIEMVDSDDESDDLDTKKNVKIKANIGIGFCEKHGFLPFAIGKCDCNSLHLCKFYLLSDCPNKLCKFGHKLKTEHNLSALKNHKLHRLTGEEIINFLADVDNRNKETIPNICKYYVREKGCYKGDNTDYETICHSLHLCSYLLKGKCMNQECDRSHSIYDKQPLSLLQKYGFDPYELGDEKVFQILSEKCIESENGKKSNSYRYKQPTNISSNSGTMPRSLSANKGGANSDTAEGLQIVTKSETKISSKYFVQNFKAPAVCKFYQNAMGCRQKDWGVDGKCYFLHVCQHFVKGDCNYGDKCKRSHDLFSGQAAEILTKYNFDLDNMTVKEILKRLNSNSGAPVELPPEVENEPIEITIDSVGEPDEIDVSNFEIPKHLMETETRVKVEENDGFTSETEDRQRRGKDNARTSSVAKRVSSYESCNIEDVIKHIMEHKKVDKK